GDHVANGLDVRHSLRGKFAGEIGEARGGVKEEGERKRAVVSGTRTQRLDSVDSCPASSTLHIHPPRTGN
ncbi:unnamed protein product, partial [Ectocarpus sp. 4 AP-2014]